MSAEIETRPVRERSCPICLEPLSSKPTVVLAVHPSSCRHEFCEDCIERLFFNLLRSRNYEVPIFLNCPICRSQYEIFESVWEICLPVWNVDRYEGLHFVDLTSDN